MANLRIPIDANVVAYYGFDEANETDLAVDLSGNGRDLTVNSSPNTQIGRVANARLFNGTSTYCSIANSVPFRSLSSDLTILTWARLDGTNTGGSLLRCITACDGTTGAQTNNTQFALFVDNNGAIVYRHEYSTGLVVQFVSASSIMKAGVFQEIGIIRKTDGAGQCTVSLIFNNVQTSWSTCSVNGVGQSPTASVPYPDGGSVSTFKVGKSDKAVDGAYWYGSQDEITIHSTARSYKPYCVSAYYAVALSPLLSKITGHGNVSNVSTAEVGGGTRWWTYERDQDIFIVREAPLGLFWPEVRLTSGPNGTPAGASNPAVVYDPVNDLLTIFFVSSGHIYKITATAADIPSTQVMPNLADTGGAIKMNDLAHPENNPAFSASVYAGAGATLYILPTFSVVSHLPVKIRFSSDATQTYAGAGTSFSYDTSEQPWMYGGSLPSAAFVATPTYAAAFTSISNITGYTVYARYGGSEVYLGTASYNPYVGWYYALPSRQDGAQYYAIPMDRWGILIRNKKTNIITDHVGGTILIGTLIARGRDGDGVDALNVGRAGETLYGTPAMTITNHFPTKLRADGGTIDPTRAGGTLSSPATISGTGRPGMTVTVYTS